MSDFLTAAAQALNAPEVIVKRSAEARAKAVGATADDILKAWAGGEVIAMAAPSVSAAPVMEQAAPVAPQEVAAAIPIVAAIPIAATPTPVTEAVGERVKAAPLGDRVRVAGRVGAWTGGILGFFAIIMASAWLLPRASVVGAEGSFSPAVEVTASRFIIATTLISIMFGLAVATLSRTVTGLMGPGMALVGKGRTTVAMGLGLGMVLGVVAGSLLVTGFGHPIESLPGVVNLPVFSAIIVVLIGGVALGWITAALVQLLGVPEGVDEHHAEELSAVRKRLGGAIGVPTVAASGLALLVLPFALVLIRSDEFARGGAAAVGVVAAISILTFAGLSASQPGMKITVGEFLVALAGIGVVIVIIVAVLLARRGPVEPGTAEAVEALAKTLANLRS